MSIEESVMREAKTSGGSGHGALCCEDALGSWFLFIEHASKVSEDYAGSIRRQLTHLATSILIQLSPPRPEILWPLKLLLTFFRRIIFLIRT